MILTEFVNTDPKQRSSRPRRPARYTRPNERKKRTSTIDAIRRFFAG